MARVVLLLCFCLPMQAFAYDGDKLSITTPPQKVTIINNDLGIYKQTKLVNQEAKPLVNHSTVQITSGEFRQNKVLSQTNFIEEQNLSEIIGGSTTYQLGRFSAETGIINKSAVKTTAQTTGLAEQKQFFLQGTYVVVQQEKLNIAVLAKIEAFEDGYIQVNNELEFSSINKEQEPLTNTTLGFIGSYAISPRWAIVGSITTSQSNTEEVSGFIESDTNHSALIGTTYSF